MNSERSTSRNDELGMLLRDISQAGVNVRALIGDVKERVADIDAATGEITQGNLDLAVRTDQSADSLQQTASSMEEISSTVRNSAEHAQSANELAAASLAVVREGSLAAERVNQVIHDIAAASRRIGDITGIIDNIAFQTNLLSLNAAVEAARAGEAGKGFAVVASEVRALAHRSATASREIKQLTADNASKVNTGAEFVSESNRSMQAMEQSVRSVNALINEIATAAQ